MKYLDAPVEGIDHVDAIVIIDLQSGRQLKLPRPGPLPSEVVEQLPCSSKTCTMPHCPSTM